MFDFKISIAKSNIAFDSMPWLALAGWINEPFPSHSHWLHFRVRPPLNALVLSGKKERGKVRHMDGRWTLAFYDGKSSSRAKDLVEEKRQLLRQTSAAMLAPLDPAKALKLAA